MAKTSPPDERTDLTTLADNILQDSRKLLSQQVDLLRAEVGEQLGRAAGAGLSIAAGGGLAAAGGLMAGFTLVHLLRDVTGLPLWCCYGLAAGTAGGAALALLRAGRQQLAEVDLLPRQTAEALGENLTWLKEQLDPKVG